MTEVKNLWPSDLGKPGVAMPKQILLRQAQYLSETTQNILVAEVKTNQGVAESTNDKVILHEFIIKAPTMGNYQFTLLSVVHDFNIYPLTVINKITDFKTTAQNEQNFLEVLSGIFSSSKVKNVINSLVIQDV